MKRLLNLLAVVVAALLLAPAVAAAQFSSPIASPRVTSNVSHTSGGRNVNYACTAFSRTGHKGTDFGVSIGTPVYAAAAGTVLRAHDGCANNGYIGNRCGGGFGNHVIIGHADGTATLYAHLSPGSVEVRTGDATGETVTCGQRIGLSGHSGNSTGPHLHFEVRSGSVSSVGAYYARGATDPYGGPCSSQSNSLWNGGDTPTSTCSSTRMGDNSQFVSATYPDPVWVEAGQEITQRWTLRNNGTTTWGTTGNYRLTRISGPTLDGMENIAVASDVAPNATNAFEVTVRAPTTPGTYVTQYRMRSDSNTGFGTTVTVRLRVANSARTCRSSTLGENVNSGACVQVNYRGCGAASCAWFRCADGAWQCASESSCAGDTHANAECADGSAAQCKMAAEACTSVSECCGGYLCAASSAGSRQCCVGAGLACQNDGDCCGRMTCGSEGTCECVGVGEPASSTLECCGSAYRLPNGTCGYAS